jgi:hypothetical protein
MAPIDPCDVDQSLEEIFRLQLEFKDESTEVFVKSDDKVTYSGAPIYHMLIGGRIPKFHEQSIDENGLKTISNLSIDDLLMSSETWRKDFNLPSFGEILSNTSLTGADLESDDQAAALKQAFINFPNGALQMAIAELFKKCKEKFMVENFPVPHEESENPLKKMMQMQQLMVAIQTRIVLSVEVVEKLWRKTCRERPQTLNHIRAMEVALATRPSYLRLESTRHPDLEMMRSQQCYAKHNSRWKELGLMVLLKPP